MTTRLALPIRVALAVATAGLSAGLLAPTPAAAATALRVTSSTQRAPIASDGDGRSRIIGEVVNDGDTNVENVTVNIDLLDSSGRVLGADFAFLELFILAPRERSPFVLRFTPPPGYSTYRVTSVTGDPTTAPADHAFLTTVTGMSPDSAGNTRIIGRIANRGETAQGVRIIVTLYDASGRAVGISRSVPSTPGRTLEAGQTAFWITARMADAPQVSTAAVIAEAGALASSPTPAAPSSKTVDRLAGPDRIETAIAISKATFPGRPAAVLSRSDSPADALAGSALAAAYGVPLLLTPSAQLDGRTGEELRRVVVRIGFVYLLGGDRSLSGEVEAGVHRLGLPTIRLSGADRFETAVTVADRALGNPPVILLATGLGFSDALVAGAGARPLAGAVLLTSGDVLPAATRTYLDGRSSAVLYAVGGPASRAKPEATPVVGSDAVDTAIRMADLAYPRASTFGLASSVSYPDALAGGVRSSYLGGPLLLSPPASMPDRLSGYLREQRSRFYGGTVFGGPNAVSENVRSSAQAAIS